jgi:hypothetical protein
MVYTQMLFALAGDKLVWGTTPGALSIIGSSLILGSAIYVAMHKESPSTSTSTAMGGGGSNGRDRGRGRGRGIDRGMGEGDRDEEQGLMSPNLLALGEVGEEGDMDVQLQTLRV